MKKTRVLESKQDLLKFRNELNEKKFTEANLIYRAGKYVMTYFTGQVTEFELMDLGFRKKSKEYKKAQGRY